MKIFLLSLILVLISVVSVGARTVVDELRDMGLVPKECVEVEASYFSNTYYCWYFDESGQRHLKTFTVNSEDRKKAAQTLLAERKKEELELKEREQEKKRAAKEVDIREFWRMKQERQDEVARAIDRREKRAGAAQEEAIRRRVSFEERLGRIQCQNSCSLRARREIKTPTCPMVRWSCKSKDLNEYAKNLCDQCLSERVARNELIKECQATC